jgi:hypothetical protein
VCILKFLIIKDFKMLRATTATLIAMMSTGAASAEGASLEIKFAMNVKLKM